MTGSDEIAARAADKLEQRYLGDTKCRVHRGQTSQIRWVGGLMIPVLAAGCFVGFNYAMRAEGDARAAEERNIGQDKLIKAVDKRVDEFKDLVIGIQKTNAEMVSAMQKTNTEIARSVGQIEGMLAVKMKGD